ncbi:hypothetical protein NE237_004046 [Protea cynaroides]|uniref:Splicing factor 3B subunit 1 n=1 Tax=Protea cynaroides TaxID=273540 RepID=A0A9Q0QT81_9MAGN|nr:hypothetical protein NE237_004046 [Protea cynaroides]
MAFIDGESSNTQEEKKKEEQQLASLTSITNDVDLYGEDENQENQEIQETIESEDVRERASHAVSESVLKEMPGGVDDVSVRAYADVTRKEVLERDKEEEERKALERERDARAALEPQIQKMNQEDQSLESETSSKKTESSAPLYAIQEENHGQQFNFPEEAPGELPFMESEGYKYFVALLNEENEEKLSPDQQRQREILNLLLMAKSGTPSPRKTTLTQLTDEVRELGELVRPLVSKFFAVLEPLLIIDEYTRARGREITSNLSKTEALAIIVAAIQSYMNSIDEAVRNTTAKDFNVIASALGIPAILPFLKSKCQSEESWKIRYTGITIVQQIAILIGRVVLPHLSSLVEIVKHGLNDENQNVRMMTALSLAALAEASAPNGIESFDLVLKPLWEGILSHHGVVLAAFLKAIGFIIPLMDAENASYHTKELMCILIREFQSPDEEMKRIVLKVVKQCVSTAVEADYICNEILPEFFRNFWVRRMALDRKNYRQVVDTTVEIAKKVGVTAIVERLVDDLKDKDEPYRRMVMETIGKVVTNLDDCDFVAEHLEVKLLRGIQYAFQEQTSYDEDDVILNGFAAVVYAIGYNIKPHLQTICGTIVWWGLMNNDSTMRQQAVKLVQKIAVVMRWCLEDRLLDYLNVLSFGCEEGENPEENPQEKENGSDSSVTPEENSEENGSDSSVTS